MTKYVLITGCFGGIGKELTSLYLNDGYKVIGLDKCRKSYFDNNKNFIPIYFDLKRLVKESKIREQFFKYIRHEVDQEGVKKFVLINNAAVQILKSVETISDEDWDTSLAVNTLAPFILITGLIGQLEKLSGHVVNVSSIHTKLSKSNFTCYAASKSAMDSITKSLALELSSKGISINSVCPAAISTDMLREGFKNNPSKFEQLSRFHPTGSIGTTYELASFIKSITEQPGNFLTGSLLEISGGIGSRLHDPD